MSRTLQGLFLAGFVGLVCGLIAGIIHKEWLVGLLVGWGCGSLCLPGALMLCAESAEKYPTKKRIDPWDTDYL